MKGREFSKAVAGVAWAALMVSGALSLAGEAAVSSRAQEVAGGTNFAVGQVASTLLEYREVGYTFVSWSVGINTTSPASKREPVFKGDSVVRGTLELGRVSSNEVAFAWDRTARKLYLDLNGNRDLTDDQDGMFSCPKGPMSTYSQTFTNIHLPCRTAHDSRVVLVDLTFYNYGQVCCTAAGRAFWQGKVNLHGEEWQVGLLWSPGQQRSLLESRDLLLRPWSERNEPFEVNSGSLAAVPFARMLFVGKHAYKVKCVNEPQEAGGKVRMEFAEEQPKLGELRITGGFVQRATLEGRPYLIVLDKPEGIVQVPTGNYSAVKVWLKKGAMEACLDERTRAAATRITVTENTTATLTVGGPLTNSVALSRQGRRLAMSYQVVGAGGAYRMLNVDLAHPPEFTVYKGDKKLASGQFQFG